MFGKENECNCVRNLCPEHSNVWQSSPPFSLGSHNSITRALMSVMQQDGNCCSAVPVHSCNHTRGLPTTYYPPPIPTPNLLSLVFPPVTSLIFPFSHSDQGGLCGTACSFDSVAYLKLSHPLSCQTELEGLGNFILEICVVSKHNVAVCFLLLRSSLTCPHCLKQSNTFDPFLCISLPIPLRQTR